MLLVVGIGLGGCIAAPTPTPTPQPTPTATENRDPRPTPETRTAPTLPPTYTPTASHTPTATYTPTATPTLTPTLSPEDICNGVVLELTLAEGVTIDNVTGVSFLAGVVNPDATLEIFIQTQPDGAPEKTVLPGGQYYLLAFGQGMPPGEYTWSAQVQTSQDTDICAQSGHMTLSTPEPEKEPSLFDEILDVILRRLRDSATPDATETPDMTASPEVMASPDAIVSPDSTP